MQNAPNDNIVNKKWYKKWWVIFFGFILLILLLGVAAFGFMVAHYYKEIKSGKNIPRQFQIKKLDPATLKKIEGNLLNPSAGTSSPKITIVEFADFSCSHCKEFFGVLREASFKYPDQIKIIFRDYPVVSEHSMLLANAGRCAAEQGKFWPMHDKMFINQGVSKNEELYSLFEQTGGNVNQFKSCLIENKYQNLINEDILDAQELKIEGTPTWFINGQLMPGGLSQDQFDQLIEKMINN